MPSRHVAVIDVGKTNVKLALVDLSNLSEVAVLKRPNIVQPGPPWPHFDVEGHWAFLLDGLAQLQASHGIDAITATTHGASCALIDKDGKLAAPVLDYEHPGPDEVREEYEKIRPPFSETGTPALAGGLNIGAQLFWQFKVDPTLMARTAAIITYPQYWTYRLTGVLATDLTSIGCHSDLWAPKKQAFSSLVDRLEIKKLLPKPKPPDEVLGPVLPAIAEATDLPSPTPVLCGIHDSNASLVPHLKNFEPPFSVVSTGTWVIAMAVGGKPKDLDQASDSLINVNYRGEPVPTAPFMGGREFDIATGGQYAEPSIDDMQTVLSQGLMLLPAVVPDTGPFKGRKARWVGSEPDVGSPMRNAAIGFYLALVTAHNLNLIGHRGPIILEGPFVQNGAFQKMLAAAAKSQVIAMGGTTGTSQGAALLVEGTRPVASRSQTEEPDQGRLAHAFQGYINQWREEV